LYCSLHHVLDVLRGKGESSSHGGGVTKVRSRGKVKGGVGVTL
jgi:hypothetical protein